MAKEIVRLWEGAAPYGTGGEDEFQPYLEAYPPERDGGGPTGAVIICPGGGYARRAEHEGEPVARWLNGLGIAAFVLHYRVSPARHPAPLEDALRAIRIVRGGAERWNVKPDRIAMLGFSAGGHLASCAGTLWDEGRPDSEDALEREISSRPDHLVLGYPVITSGIYRHAGSFQHLLGDEPDPALMELLSTERRIDGLTPPTFLWHTADDASVPVENALLFATGLRKAGVPFELHVYESGRHGLGLALDHDQAYPWSEACGRWLIRQGYGRA
ncbi:alpha/beta hydrolase [Paenibacillus thermoaerophilus]|uniref:Alpha/beta hydrolase n=1 Tax=Paenibacillus thermoaerophilus TaxID=1215385 RepID=A0ABW2V8U5_9BACL|nr:alpha/beta hydrolase [Paenibacillus thermoaerophilus]TMV15921.1 alpha/beta hydrolase [Paenibacillus thermoaerophilus]